MRIVHASRIPGIAGLAAVLLAGCASNPAPVVDRSLGGETPAAAAARNAPQESAAQPSGGEHANGEMTAQGYRVARGDTLYSIAFTHGMDFRALAARNDIAPPYTIHPGQVLRIDAGPGAAPGNALAAAPQSSAQERKPAGRAPSTTGPRNAPANNAPVFGPVENNPAGTTGAPAHEVAASSSSGVTTLPQVNLAQGSVPTAAAHAGPANRSGANPNAPTPPPAQQAAATAPLSAAESKPLPAIAAGRTRDVDGIAWQWPADGAVISGFQPDGSSSAGLDIAGNAGDPVRAAADGVVVYSGNGLIGYGELIIIKHSDNYLSAYGHNRKRLVQEGQHVRAGQLIAEMGSSGAPREELHFEIRKNGKPVDPTAYLPGR